MLLPHALRSVLKFVSPTGWDISTASFDGGYLGRFSILSQDGSAVGLFFKPDGTKMYIIGSVNDRVYEYNLSLAWHISTASFVQNISIAIQDTNPTGLYFSPDGTKMYIVGSTNDRVHRYNLSTAWDISTAVVFQNFSVNTQETIPTDLFFKPDGTKMYIVGSISNSVHEYNLSSAWDLSTTTFVRSLNINAQESNVNTLFFKPDGTKMYILGSNNNRVHEYNLSSAWDISTAVVFQNFSNTQETGLSGLFFKDDGTKMYVVGTINDRIREFNLSSGWNVSTATLQRPQQDYSDIISGRALFFKDDGSSVYSIAGSIVYQYSLSTAWNISTASFVRQYTTSLTVDGVGLFFKPDGTKMYFLNNAASAPDNLKEYNLSSAWDISTAIFVQDFSVSTQDTTPQGLYFRNDGTKMYMIGALNDRVYEYNLSSAWDISTAIFSQSFRIANQDSSPVGVFFKPDGTKMYMIGNLNDRVYEYNLSSAWNVTTASFIQNFSVAPQDTSPTSLFFKSDGTKMYISGTLNESVWAYNL